MKRALVLAGGGVAGIAWELGVLRGLQDADSELAGRVLAADLVIGTSAGSAVAAQITSGVPLADLYDRQLSPESAEIEVQLDMEDLLARFTAAGAAARRRTTPCGPSARSRWTPTPWPSRYARPRSRPGCPSRTGLTGPCCCPRSTRSPAS